MHYTAPNRLQFIPKFHPKTRINPGKFWSKTGVPQGETFWPLYAYSHTSKESCWYSFYPLSLPPSPPPSLPSSIWKKSRKVGKRKKMCFLFTTWALKKKFLLHKQRSSSWIAKGKRLVSKRIFFSRGDIL